MQLKYGKKLILNYQKKNKLFIKIEDDGPGIPENEYDNVFKPFYKIDKGEQTQNLVLVGSFNCLRYIRSHGGNIKLRKI